MTQLNEIKNNGLEQQRFQQLQLVRDQQWNRIAEDSNWYRFVLDDDYDRRFYAIFLIETYHYVIHNSRHQALVGTRGCEMRPNYIKFCYKHAEEESGHEMMAFHDILNLGIELPESQVPLALASTQTLIGYLYYIAQNGNPLRRLGYSFWAEDSYQYVQNIMESLVSKLGLETKNTTFLVAHAQIDAEHSAEVEEMVLRYCKTEDDWDAVEEVLITSLRLQSQMMDDALLEYQKLLVGSSNRYEFLNELIA